MIPRRVKLRGFLSYKNEQEISFEGPRLWMLAGTNGSGKSTIFDAVTFALFGQHRGGGQQLVELINKSSNDALVEFEFSSDNKRYMIKRTLKRDKHGGAKGTQNAYRWSEEISNWQAIEDTNLAGPLRAWVKDTIGLDYETFTASILLLQGKSEKLLDSTPSGRAEVLAGIVDLERYQKLFEKADAKRKTLKSKLDTLSDQLKLIPEVSPMEFLVAENEMVEAEALVKTLEEEVETLRNLETTAKLYAEASRHAQELQNRLQTYQNILAQSADLEAKYRRWLELKTVAPHFEQISEKESDRREAERKAKEL
ncbi:MAG: SMC family ATPase, partial [Gemmataceae bacterium]|nr:SMC family ATPase [Gemmataceae bacterium]